MSAFGLLSDHLLELRAALADLERHEAVLHTWAWQLAEVFANRGRLLAAGNGGSAAEAQHLTAELVGRFQVERAPLSAIALHAETSSLTALLNDFAAEEVFARQVAAHGRPGDVLILLSTSGRSANLLRAADTARGCGLLVWALTGPAPNPLALRADAAVAVDSPSPTAVQEAHLVAVHALCAATERRLTEPVSAGRPRLHAVGHRDGHLDGGPGLDGHRATWFTAPVPPGASTGAGAAAGTGAGAAAGTGAGAAAGAGAISGAAEGGGR